MAPNTADKQEESRSETMTMRLTPTEKTAVKVVAGLRSVDESNLLRDLSLADVMTEFRRIKATA